METGPARRPGGESGGSGGGHTGENGRFGEQRFQALYRAYAVAVLAYAIRRTASRVDAEEVFAETMTTCWRRLDDVPEGDGALPWLYAVCARVLTNHRRGQRRRLRLLDRVRSHESVAARVRSAGGDIDQLDRALAVLSEDERELLRLAAWEQLRPAEIAAVLGITPNAAAVRLHRARRSLRHAYEHAGEEGAR